MAANFISAIAMIVNVVLSMLYWLILIRALISWVNPDPHNGVVQFLYGITEPVLSPIRRMLPFALKMTIDISPIIAFLIVLFLQSFLVQTLFDLAARLRGA
ncbi:MAG: YggT family protein [Eubacteriales bacterium]|nr:YggT family protein [Eubacteriales bacterium]